MPPTLWLTAAQVEAVRRAYAAGLTRTEAAWAAGVPRRQLDARLRDQLRDLRVGQGKRGRMPRRRRLAELTPEQLLEAIADVRSRWSPTDELAHRVSTWHVYEGRWDGVHDLGPMVRQLQRLRGAS